MAIDYTDLRANVASLISDFGMSCAISHLTGTQSRGNIVFSSTDNTDISIPDVGTVEGQSRVAFINDVRNEICVGDTVTANAKSYRVREVRPYKPATINCGYRVVLDI